MGKKNKYAEGKKNYGNGGAGGDAATMGQTQQQQPQQPQPSQLPGPSSSVNVPTGSQEKMRQRRSDSTGGDKPTGATPKQQQEQRAPERQQQGQRRREEQRQSQGQRDQQHQGQRGLQQQPQQGIPGHPQKSKQQGYRGAQQKSQQPQGQWIPQQQGQSVPQQQQPQGQRGPQKPQQSQAQGGRQQKGQRAHQPKSYGQQQRQHGQQQQQQPYMAQLPRQQQRQSSVPSCLSSVSSQSVSQNVSKGNIPRGTQGRRGTVEVNYLNINMDNMPDLAYHYDVEITPDRPKMFMRPAFDQFNRQYFPKTPMAFDGRKSCYTATRLPESSVEKEIEIDDTGSRKISFKIAAKETQDMEIDLKSLKSYYTERVYDKPMRALQCLEVVLASPCHNKGVRVGRSFYTKPPNKYDLNDGYEMWTGLYQAAILGDIPFLNVDISHKSFPSECDIVDYIQHHIRNSDVSQPLSDDNISDLKAFLKSINIIYEPPKSFGQSPRTYKVNDVSREPANMLSFTMDDGKKLTVAEYFSSKGYNLKYPNLNCLHVGSTVKNIYVPIECCKIPAGQAINKKDGEQQVREMIKRSKSTTNERKGKIMDLLSHFDHNTNIQLINFGIRIGNAFKVVPMRILDSPLLEYYSRDTIKPFRGAWRMNDNTKFLLTNPSHEGYKWAVIYNNPSRLKYDSINEFADKVSKLSRKLNMFLAPKFDIKSYNDVGDTLKEFKKKNYDLVFVVLPSSRKGYANVKQQAELKIGQLTQCIKENTIERRCDMQTITNILLKVNGKLNGTNHKINSANNMTLQNVMFLGADVTHPSPDQKHIPSVVGVAASHDANGACYNMQYRLQRSTVENIEDMEEIFAQHMKVYFQYQNKYPEHIIYYRDGVSDGQFPIVKRNELSAIRAVCSKLRCQPTPKLTCIIVIKRHHTRFFPTTVNPRDKFNNVEPGTVVDQVIVHPNEVQFFMVSHQSIQGTAKPTRYNVIEDDAKMNIDDLQKLTYNLCHMFPRCNRVVSYPAPAYLAHLVAFRGRVYIEGTYKFDEPKKEYDKRIIKVDFMQRNPMYFI